MDRQTSRGNRTSAGPDPPPPRRHVTSSTDAATSCRDLEGGNPCSGGQDDQGFRVRRSQCRVRRTPECAWFKAQRRCRYVVRRPIVAPALRRLAATMHRCALNDYIVQYFRRCGRTAASAASARRVSPRGTGRSASVVEPSSTSTNRRSEAASAARSYPPSVTATTRP